MNRTTNIWVQVIGIIGSVAAVAAPVLPEQYKPIAVGVLTALQGLTALLAHNSNPDGTPATVAFVPTEKK